jgi:hypothetical protein
MVAGADGNDTTRGTGPEKVTEAVSPDFDASPHAQETEPTNSSEPDPAAGVCMRFGWGCLPALIGAVALPVSLVS